VASRKWHSLAKVRKATARLSTDSIARDSRYGS
jgi:hypothetical protein